MDKSSAVTSVKTAWDYLIGNPSEFTLESRIFNSLCLIGLIAIAYHIPFNFLIGLPVPGFIAIALLVFQSGFYYLARFRRKLQTSVLLTGITIHVLFILNYYFNSGINGPTLLLLVLSFFIILTVAPIRPNILWIFVNLAVVVVLLISEYYYPQLIFDAYTERAGRFIDTDSAYLVTIILIYIGTSFIKRNYNKERRSAEEQAVSMKKLNDEKDKLFSIVSHDLRAPLATIVDYLQVLSEADLEPKEKQRFENDLLQITRNTQDLLTNILIWSTSQMEGLKANIQKINVLKALHPTLTVQRAIASKKGLKLDFTIDPSLQVLADPDMLQVIIRNLIHNSIKFTERGGEIQIVCQQQQTHCLFTVRDTGIGISDTGSAAVFSLKAHSTYGTQNEKGVGLGLLLCKEFTEIQNGKIWLESIEGKGTVFYIALPSDEKVLNTPRQAELFSSC